MKKIESKITGWNIVDDKDVGESGKLREVGSAKKRPTELDGATYSIRTNLLENKVYVTINDIEIDDNPGKYKPFEMFINSRDKSEMISLEILSTMLSAIFRRTSDPSFIIKELKIKSSTDGGYFRSPREGEKSGKHIPSLYFEIAEVLETHMIKLGIFPKDYVYPENDVAGEMVVGVKVLVEELKTAPSNPLGLKKCPNCKKFGIKKESGCEGCLYCEYSKCG